MARKKDLIAPAALGDNVGKVLLSHVQKIEELVEKVASAQKLVNAAMNAAKQDGFEKIPLKEVLRQRRLQNEVRVARAQKVQEYKGYLGMNDMLSDVKTPTEEDADSEAA